MTVLNNFPVKQRWLSLWGGLLFVLLFASGSLYSSCRQGHPWQNGDVIFQVTESELSLAIRDAMDSPYTHCGIICEMDGSWYVYEAIQPVGLTPLQEWIDRGKGGHYVVKRLTNADEILSPDVLRNMWR